MTKREKYDAMKKDGAKLRAFHTLRAEEVDQLYRERFGEVEEGLVAEPQEKPPVAEKKESASFVAKKIPPLYFDHGGWCNELGRSFYKGYYRPASWKEYQYLLPHAVKQ